jgi:hypothetical protein
MFDDKTIMKYENTLPENFTGTFYFTNWSETEFVGKWGNKLYTFPPQTTSPMIIPEHSPLEVQHIRKKFAKDLAEREFSDTQEYAALIKQERNPDGSPRANSIHVAGTYSVQTLTPLIQRCLEPLPLSQAIVTNDEKPPLEDTLSRNEEGELNTLAVGLKENLRKKAEQM